MKSWNLQTIFTVISVINYSTQDKVYDQMMRAINDYGKLRKSHNTYHGSNYRFPQELGPNVYDYIIVGSGAAGSVLANRLSENPLVKVLLLESGGRPMIISEVPFFASIQQFTRQNWGYVTEKQDNLYLGLVDQSMHWPRGRVLGGSSVINFMVHTRGNKLDYDRWASLGNPGWSFNDVFPYFLKSENAVLKYQDSAYHNSDGYLSVQDVPYRTKSADVFVQGCQQAGYRYVDYNGKNQIGVSYIQGTTRFGRRCSAEKAFIRPAESRPNLHIRLNSHVTRVLIDLNTKRAYGVEYLHMNTKYVVNATIEIILSAGVFHSPQILMLSGIGPHDHLSELRIPVIQNLPVGQKLYDHLTFLGLLFTVSKPIVINFFGSLLRILEFILFGTGPLTIIGGLEGIAYFKTSIASYPEMYPDIELLFVGGSVQTDYSIFQKHMLRVTDKVDDALFRPLYFKNAFSIFPLLLHPKSYGFLKLRSTNPLDPPKLYGNYYTDPNKFDVRAHIAGIRECQRIIKMPAFQQYDTQLVNVSVPGCERTVFDSDEYWECALRHLGITMYHQTSTCKMGPASDPEAVVDSRCRVYGIKRLRVIDTSIIPITLSGHPNVPAFMIGERGAEFVKQDYGNLVQENYFGN